MLKRSFIFAIVLILVLSIGAFAVEKMFNDLSSIDSSKSKFSSTWFGGGMDFPHWQQLFTWTSGSPDYATLQLYRFSTTASSGSQDVCVNVPSWTADSIEIRWRAINADSMDTSKVTYRFVGFGDCSTHNYPGRAGEHWWWWDYDTTRKDYFPQPASTNWSSIWIYPWTNPTTGGLYYPTDPGVVRFPITVIALLPDTYGPGSTKGYGNVGVDVDYVKFWQGGSAQEVAIGPCAVQGCLMRDVYWGTGWTEDYVDSIKGRVGHFQASLLPEEDEHIGQRIPPKGGMVVDGTTPWINFDIRADDVTYAPGTTYGDIDLNLWVMDEYGTWIQLTDWTSTGDPTTLYAYWWKHIVKNCTTQLTGVGHVYDWALDISDSPSGGGLRAYRGYLLKNIVFSDAATIPVELIDFDVLAK